MGFLARMGHGIILKQDGKFVLRCAAPEGAIDSYGRLALCLEA
jgi:hypothetical protein